MAIEKEKLLQIANEIVDKEGFEKLTVRRLAKKAGISIGSVYNIFESKDQLIMYIIDDYWNHAVNEIIDKSKQEDSTFIEKLSRLYKCFQIVTRTFHQDWLKELVKIQMTNPQVASISERYQKILEDYVYQLIIEDEHVRSQLNETLPADKLALFVFENIMLLLREDAEDLAFLRNVLDKMFYDETQII